MTTSSGSNMDVSRNAALLKNVYAPRVEDLVPESDRMAKDIPFSSGEKELGLEYHMPVSLTREGGFTFNTDGTVFQLNKPIAAKEETAKIKGTEFVSRTAISYGMLSRALKGVDTSTSSGKKAFVNATKDRMSKIIKGASFARECNLLYGGGASAVSCLGVVSATTGSAGTSLVVIMDPAQWATGIWAGSQDLEFDIYSSAGATRSTAGSGATTVFKLTAVDAVNYTVTFTSHATNVGNVVATDQIFFAGARTKEMLGIDGVFATSGALWNISTTTYDLWKPKAVSAGGALTFDVIQDAAAQVAEIGYSGTLRFYVNPASWVDLCNDQAALVQRSERAGGEAAMGFTALKYYSQTGAIEIVPHPYIKRGSAKGLPKGDCMRIGSTDLTFDLPGMDGKMVKQLEDYAGFEIRTYFDQAFFCRNPGYMVNITGIVNSTD